MSKMLDLIRSNAVPAAVVRSAARGALSVPAAEMIEILVFLSNNPVFAQEAKMTLAGWNEASAIAAVSDPSAPKEILEYFWSEQNRRPRLMPALIEHPTVSEQQIIEMAPRASRELVDMMLASARVKNSSAILQALVRNPRLSDQERQQLQPAAPAEAEPADPATETAHQDWKHAHDAEITAEEGKPFELTVSPDDTQALTIQEPAVPAAAPTKTAAKPDDKKLSTLQKIGRMTVAERVKTAFLGTKEERALLIRDGSKVVQNAVMASPKLSDPEVENFAAAKNVQENVLREIARSRRFMKSYVVVRNLVTNPRCPLDVSLTLIKNLLITDLKNLQSNKNVPDTVRKVAYKLYKEKTTQPGQ